MDPLCRLLDRQAWRRLALTLVFGLATYWLPSSQQQAASVTVSPLAERWAVAASTAPKVLPVALLAGLLAAAAFGALPAHAQIPADAAAAQVVRVVDGDTFVADVEMTRLVVRVIGLDTPETVAPGRAVQCYGPEASARAHVLLDGQLVHLVADPSQPARDRYNRELAHVYLPDGQLYAAALIADGYGREYTVGRRHAQQAPYRALQATAQAEGRGLWGACG